MIEHGTQIDEISTKQQVQDNNCKLEEDVSLFDRLKTSLNLPALPPIASQILKMCRDEEADVDKLAELISQDPAVVARLLHIANSSYYGGSRHKVTSIVQAITLLGMNAVGSLAFSFCFYRLFRDMNKPSQSGMDHVQFWRRSIIASIAGRMIGHSCKTPDPELIFVAALLQDIGLLALNEVAPEVTRTLTADAQGDHWQLRSLEKQYFGCDHATMGSWVAESWQLPEEFQIAISHSHRPDNLDDYDAELKSLILGVALSGRLADLWCHPDTEKAIHDATTKANEWFGLQPTDLYSIVRQIPDGLAEISSFFQIHIGSADTIEQPLQLFSNTLLTESSSVSPSEENS